MNKEWSELNKKMQNLLNVTSFNEGINTLLLLREKLMQEAVFWKDELDEKDYYDMPFMNAHGYHNKTVAYSLWHIFRIEDIVVHTLIKNDERFF